MKAVKGKRNVNYTREGRREEEVEGKEKRGVTRNERQEGETRGKGGEEEGIGAHKEIKERRGRGW